MPWILAVLSFGKLKSASPERSRWQSPLPRTSRSQNCTRLAMISQVIRLTPRHPLPPLRASVSQIILITLSAYPKTVLCQEWKCDWSRSTWLSHGPYRWKGFWQALQVNDHRWISIASLFTVVRLVGKAQRGPFPFMEASPMPQPWTLVVTLWAWIKPSGMSSGSVGPHYP